MLRLRMTCSCTDNVPGKVGGSSIDSLSFLPVHTMCSATTLHRHCTRALIIHGYNGIDDGIVGHASTKEDSSRVLDS